MILLHREVVDSPNSLLPLDLRERNRRPGASNNRVPEREPACDDEPDALNHERMLAATNYGLDDLAGFRVGEGERHGGGGGEGDCLLKQLCPFYQKFDVASIAVFPNDSYF